MANTKISALAPATTPLTGAELVPVVQGGVTKRSTVNQFGAAVGYLPAGTGAVATTVQTKLRESVSVKDFGAVGDGVTDDTVAIQAAITFGVTNAKRIFFPKGTYLVTANLTHPDISAGMFLYIAGEGRETIIQATSGATKIFDFGKTSGNVLSFATITNIALEPAVRRAVAYGIFAEYCEHCKFEDLWIDGFSGAGIYIGSTLSGYCNEFTNLTIRFCAIGVYGVGSFNENTFTHCKIYVNEVGAAIGGFAVLFSNCLFEGNCKAGVIISGLGTTLDTCYFEDNAVIQDASLFPVGTTAGITISSPSVIVYCDVFLRNGTNFPLGTSFSTGNPCLSVTVAGGYTRPGGTEAAGHCFVYAQAVKGLQISNVLSTVQTVPVIKSYGLSSNASLDLVSLSDNSGFSKNFLIEGLPDGRLIFNFALPTIVAKTTNEANYAETEFTSWVGLEALTGTFDRSGIKDRFGRNAPVWAITLATTAYTGSRGFTLNSADYPENIGKLFAFSLDFKAEVSSTRAYLTAKGTPDGFFTLADTNWSRRSGYFVWPASGNISFAAAKANNAGALYIANPILCEVGANYSDLFGVFDQQRQFYLTAAPTTGDWLRGDIVWNTTPSASGTPGWSCVTAGTPGTWKAMANLAA